MNWEIKEYQVKELATGDVITLKTYTVVGKTPGPHIHIQASVHGAELQGNAVILQLMERLNKESICGSITFIPLANPYATNNKHGTYTYGRYNPVTGHNWNRNYIDIIKDSGFDIDKFAKDNKDLSWVELRELFKKELMIVHEDYRELLANKKALSENNRLNLFLQKLASSADGILDLHTGPVATRYLYCAEYEQKVASYIKFKYVLIIPDEFSGAMDEACFMPWIHLKNACKKIGKKISLDIESLTLEFGSEETFCMTNASNDVESIINYLKYKNVLTGDAQKNEYTTSLLQDFKTIYSPTGGLVDFHYSPGDEFKKGDILASFYNFKNINPNDPVASVLTTVLAEQDGIIINRCPSSAVHQGMELYQIIRNYKKVDL